MRAFLSKPNKLYNHDSLTSDYIEELSLKAGSQLAMTNGGMTAALCTERSTREEVTSANTCDKNRASEQIVHNDVVWWPVHKTAQSSLRRHKSVITHNTAPCSTLYFAQPVGAVRCGAAWHPPIHTTVSSLHLHATCSVGLLVRPNNENEHSAIVQKSCARCESPLTGKWPGHPTCTTETHLNSAISSGCTSHLIK